MTEQIVNEYLKVYICKKGAQLWSIQDHQNTEYLWQGDTTYWADRAIHLFPYIARLTDGKYCCNGHTYEMDIHGFLKDMILEVKTKCKDEIEFELKSTEGTKKQYPFEFVCRIKYKLEGKELRITYHIENRDKKVMYFGVGGHPGFNVPLQQGLAFEDYYLEFHESREVIRVGMSEDCFVNGKNDQFPLKDDRKIPLNHSLFDNDAIILKNMADKVTLKSDKDTKSIMIVYPGMKFLGIWHKPRTDAPYICIEPWSSLPSREGIIEDIARQNDLISLRSGEVYNNTWSIAIGCNA